jgi:hypothetical protein
MIILWVQMLISDQKGIEEVICQSTIAHYFLPGYAFVEGSVFALLTLRGSRSHIVLFVSIYG